MEDWTNQLNWKTTYKTWGSKTGLYLTTNLDYLYQSDLSYQMVFTSQMWLGSSATFQKNTLQTS